MPNGMLDGIARKIAGKAKHQIGRFKLGLFEKALTRTEIAKATCGGTELSDEELAALQVGVVTGVIAARHVVDGDAGADIDRIVKTTVLAAVGAYGLTLEEAGHGEE